VRHINLFYVVKASGGSNLRGSLLRALTVCQIHFDNLNHQEVLGGVFRIDARK
jgi:hypothetical protein